MTKSALDHAHKKTSQRMGQIRHRSNVVCPGLIKQILAKVLWSDEKVAAQIPGVFL